MRPAMTEESSRRRHDATAGRGDVGNIPDVRVRRVIEHSTPFFGRASMRNLLSLLTSVVSVRASTAGSSAAAASPTLRLRRRRMAIFLAVLGVFGQDRGLFLMVASLWVALMTIVMALAVVFYIATGRGVRRVLRPTKTCPGCAQRYTAPTMGLNMLTKRYERCPYCRKWHWTPAFGEAEEAGPKG